MNQIMRQKILFGFENYVKKSKKIKRKRVQEYIKLLKELEDDK